MRRRDLTDAIAVNRTGRGLAKSLKYSWHLMGNHDRVEAELTDPRVRRIRIRERVRLMIENLSE